MTGPPQQAITLIGSLYCTACRSSSVMSFSTLSFVSYVSRDIFLSLSLFAILFLSSDLFITIFIISCSCFFLDDLIGKCLRMSFSQIFDKLGHFHVCVGNFYLGNTK